MELEEILAVADGERRAVVRLVGDDACAIFAEDEGTNERFLLGYLNSALATYFMKKLVNSTATADVGYVEKLPYRRPTPACEAGVVDLVHRILSELQGNPDADVSGLRGEIDDLIFDLFEIRASRDEVKHFYETVGRVAQEEPEADQAASA